MKNLSTIFAILMMAVLSLQPRSVFADTDQGSDTKEEWVFVSNVTEFADAVNRYTNNETKVCNANIRLTADITIGSLATFDVKFTGKIRGDKSKQNNLDYAIKWPYNILFREMDGATIKNVVFSGGIFEGRDEGSGLLAVSAKNVTMDNVIFSGIEVQCENLESYLVDYDRVGIAFGYAEGCTFSNLLFVDCNAIIDGGYLGMVAGHAKNCSFEGCVVNQGCELWADGNLTDDNSAYVGGVVGYADKCTFKHCFNVGLVSADDDRVGGIVGYGENNTTITDCGNSGVIKHCTKDGFGRLVRQDWAEDLFLFGIQQYIAGAITMALTSSGGSAAIKNNVNESLDVESGVLLIEEDEISSIGEVAEDFFENEIDDFFTANYADLAVNDNAQVVFNQNWDAVTKESFNNIYNNLGTRVGEMFRNGELTFQQYCHVLSGIERKLDLTEYVRAIIPQYYQQYSGIINGFPAGAPMRDSQAYEAEGAPRMAVSPSEVSTSTMLSLGLVTTVVHSIVHNPASFFVVGTASIATSAGLALYDVVSSPDEVGGIAGTLDHCVVTRCTNAGPVECKDEDCGGIVGHAENSTIESCYNRSFVKGYICAGGIIGYCNESTVKNCLTVGVTSAATIFKAAVAGQTRGTCTLTNNYYLADETSTDGYGFTQDKLPTGQIALALNSQLETPIWQQSLGYDFYPVFNDDYKPIVTETKELAADDLIQKVYTRDQFYLAVANPNAHIQLGCDINLQNYYFKLSSEDHPFKGTIDGNGYSIYGCSHTEDATDFEYDPNNAALFAYADGATFKDLNLSHITITNRHGSYLIHDLFVGEAFLVGSSKNSTYQNITISNSRIIPSETAGDDLYRVGGFVAKSQNDLFEDCTLEASNQIKAYTGTVDTDAAYIGGIAGVATGSTFRRCHNASDIWSDDNYDGGIVGRAENCLVTNCLNTGMITAQEKVGGIVGYGKNTTVSHCVNTGNIEDDEDDRDREDYRSGIVGYLEGSNALVENCINFGVINCVDEDNSSPINNKRVDGARYGEKNYFYCQFNGEHIANIEDVTWNNMQIGEYALNMTDVENKPWLYQTLDNASGFATSLPVPIPSAGKVYSNVLCDGTQSYSNIYRSTGEHEASANKFGYCSVCGKHIGTPSTIEIGTADELQQLAQSVNQGRDYSAATIRLTADIDMTGVTDYTPIGCQAHPYLGTFNGNSHHIKNLRLNSTKDGVGLFGYVYGGSTITDLTIDESCSFQTTGSCIAAFVGKLVCPAQYDYASFERCMNEASVSGISYASAYVGHREVLPVFTDCANKGTISGGAYSSVFADEVIQVNRCWNIGSVSGNVKDEPLGAGGYAMWWHIKNLINIDTMTDNWSLSCPAIDFLNGFVCNRMIETKHFPDWSERYTLADLEALAAENPATAWGQNLGYDTYPKLNGKGLYHERPMTSTWGTLILPWEVESNKDVQLYKMISCSTLDEGAVTLEPVDKVAANTPCFFKKLDSKATKACFVKGDKTYVQPTDDEANVVTFKSLTTDAPGWNLCGLYFAAENIKKVYFIAQDKLWYAENAITIPAMRAVLLDSETSVDVPTLSIYVKEDDEMAKIGEITPDGNLNFYDTPIYNIQGQRQQIGQKGLQIRGGRVILNY